FDKYQSRLTTEHPQLSDDGTDTVDLKAKEPPIIARVTTFNVDRPVTVSDPKLQALLNENKDLEQKIEALRIAKPTMSQDDFDKQMEDLAIKLATKNQEIRAQE